MGTSALTLVTGTDADGEECSARLYRHYDGYPDSALSEIARILGSSPGSPGDAAMAARALVEGSMDEKGRPDFRMEGGPWEGPLTEERMGRDEVEWVYRIDTAAMRVDVFGSPDGSFKEGLASELMADGPVDPLGYIKGKDAAEYAGIVRAAVARLEAAGFGVNAPAPTPLSMDDRALKALADAPKKATLSELYDSDQAVSEACTRLFPGFEYPDHSWKTMERLASEAARNLSDARALIASALSTGPGLDRPRALSVPFMEKGEAETAGAQWYPALKSWAAPAGSDPGAFSKWEPKAEGGTQRDAAARAAEAVFSDATGALATEALLAMPFTPETSGRSCLQMLCLGADPCAVGESGEPILLRAAAGGAAKAVKALCDGGADPDAPGPKRETALHAAAAAGFHRVAGALARAGADPDAKDSSGMTALHRAAEGGWAKTIASLVAAGADTEAVDAKGRTPLLKAAYYGKADAARALLDAGADVGAVDKAGLGVLEAVEAAGRSRKNALPPATAATVSAFLSDALEAASKGSPGKGEAKAAGAAKAA